jgi:hypothetical protein
MILVLYLNRLNKSEDENEGCGYAAVINEYTEIA